MNYGAFIVAAYAIAVGGTAALLTWCWTSMRRAERRAEDLTGR